MSTKALVSLSGGMDSATLLPLVVRLSKEVTAVSFDYGSKHNEFEIECAGRLAAHYEIQHETIDLTGVMESFKSDLLLSGGEIPEGHYEEESMSKTVVPARNMIFASILTGLAWSRDAREVWMGVHAGDHAIYPDCRPNFLDVMGQAMLLGSDHRVALFRPFVHWTKTAILASGLHNGVPYEKTRTCYKAQEVACGKCGACTERLEAFAANNQKDPIEYEERNVKTD